jgi:hypothetical protein
MFNACLHCNRTLDRNDSIESFPIGRRIAFDPVKGRLWAVCRHCERWNLSPIEERWEAIEQCERAFRETRTRVSTENIGLARLRDGTELVRVGKPLRPELAAWRYGDQFGRRRKKALMMSAGGVVGAGVVLAGGAAIGLTVAALGPLVHVLNLATLARIASARSSQPIALPGGQLVHPFGAPRLMARPDVPEGWGIALGYSRSVDPLVPGARVPPWKSLLRRNQSFPDGEVRLRGSESDTVLRWALPRVNRSGASRTLVSEGVALLESAGPVHQFGTWAASQLSTWSAKQTFGDSGDIKFIPAPARLAFEMALHEESERRALEGELAALEAAWRHADEIARIADGLLLTPIVQNKLEMLRAQGRASEVDAG